MDSIKLRMLFPGAVMLSLVNSMPVAAQTLEEIVVTAQKREQNTQDIGIAITALSGDNLKEMGISEPVDLAAQVPGIDIKYPEGRINPIITIRGVGLNDNRPNSNPSTAVHVDEVYMGSAAYLTNQLFDIERVEILKGPQGTLYGRNSTAGTVNFITKAPGQKFDAYIDTRYGNYNSWGLQGAVGGGITDTVSARLAFDYKQSDGYVTNKGSFGYEDISLFPNIPAQSFFGKDDKAGEIDVASWRGSLLFEPNDNFDALISVHGGQDNSANTIWATVDSLVLPGVGPAFLDTDNDPNDRYESFRPELDADTSGGMIKLNYNFDFATLTSITAYEGLDRISSNGSGTPIQNFRHTKDIELSQLTQELRLTSSSESDFQWIIGAFYSEDEVDVTETIDARITLLTDLQTDYVQDGESWAIFAHTEWQLTDALKLITGIRYTEEEKVYEGGTSDLNPYNSSCVLLRFNCGSGQTVDLGGPVPFVNVKKVYDADALSGKIGLDWQVNEDTLVYGSVSEGFKSGGIDGSTIFSEEDLTPFDEETVRAYEVGLKMDFLDGTSRLNASVFYYDYTDMQVQATVINQTTTLANTLRTNAGEAAIKGAEIEWLWLPAEGLSINLGAAFLDSEIKKWNSVDPDERDIFEGNQVPDAPELTFNGMVRYQWVLESGMQAAVMTDFNFNDDTYRELENNPYYATDSYWLVNGLVSLTSADDSWTLSLWGRNLADENYVTSTSDTPATGRWELPGAPRTYGVSLNYRWQ